MSSVHPRRSPRPEIFKAALRRHEMFVPLKEDTIMAAGCDAIGCRPCMGSGDTGPQWLLLVTRCGPRAFHCGFDPFGPTLSLTLDRWRSELHFAARLGGTALRGSVAMPGLPNPRRVLHGPHTVWNFLARNASGASLRNLGCLLRHPGSSLH